jgi:polyisoprenoid-binding protein YceI
MKNFFIFAFLCLKLNLLQAQTNAEFFAKLSPAGSFTGATKAVTGFAIVDGDKVSASNIEVDLTKLTTGLELRDKHTQDHLETSKYPKAKLITAQGVAGKGTGEIEIKGIKKSIEGTYSVKNNFLTAEFNLNLPDFNIKGIRYMGVGLKDNINLKVTIPVNSATVKPTSPPNK